MSFLFQPLIPAKAGIQIHPPAFAGFSWIPAFAGMSAMGDHPHV